MRRQAPHLRQGNLQQVTLARPQNDNLFHVNKNLGVRDGERIGRWPESSAIQHDQGVQLSGYGIPRLRHRAGADKQSESQEEHSPRQRRHSRAGVRMPPH
jgi:hypothetical protein